MKLNKFLLIGLIVLNFSKTFGTGQIPDYIIIDKDTMALSSNPLEGYFKIHPLAEKENHILSTALWRGYKAYFKFFDNKLVVENIYEEQEIKNSDKNQFVSIYKQVFGEKLNFECCFYNGLLVGQGGKIIERLKPGFWDVYEKYKLIELSNGKIAKTLDFNNKEFIDYKNDYFKKYKKTEKYNLQFKEQYSNSITNKDSFYTTKKNLTFIEKKQLVKKSVEDYIFYFLFEKFGTSLN